MKLAHRALLVSCCSLLVLLPLACRSAQPAPQQSSVDFAESRKLGRDAFGRKDFAAAANHFRDALRVAPTHPSLLFNLAAMETLSGNHDEALAALERLAELDLYLNVEGEETFGPLAGDPRFQDVVRRLSLSRESVVTTSSPFFGFEGKGLIPEGLAFDEKNGVFLVSSVRERRIFRVTPEGESSEFAGPTSGLLAAMGMRADSARRILWVASSAAPQMVGFETSDRGGAAVFKFDLDSGRLLNRYSIDPEGANKSEHWFGDLTLSPDGTVYVTDSTQPEVYRISTSTDRLELFIRDEQFQSLQGIDLSRDGRSIFVADYSTGIYRVDIGTKRVVHLESPQDSSLAGIDGIYRCGNNLLAVQNGINPNRLIRLELDQNRVHGVEVIDLNHPQHKEPTLGVVAGSRFAYIANGYWGAVDANNQLLPAEKLEDPVILGFEARCR